MQTYKIGRVGFNKETVKGMSESEFRQFVKSKKSMKHLTDEMIIEVFVKCGGTLEVVKILNKETQIDNGNEVEKPKSKKKSRKSKKK